MSEVEMTRTGYDFLLALRPLFGNATAEPAHPVGALSSMVRRKSGGIATVFSVMLRETMELEDLPQTAANCSFANKPSI